MFVIKETDEEHTVEECAQCMEEYNITGYGGENDVCTNCEKRVKTTFSCPNCRTTHTFFSDKMPVHCISCKVLLPEISDLKVSQEKRISYHLSKSKIII